MESLLGMAKITFYDMNVKFRIDTSFIMPNNGSNTKCPNKRWAMNMHKNRLPIIIIGDD